jgi:DNA-binding NarL/FixJ family response regulator
MRQTHKLSILIVDDHLLIRLGLRQLLSDEYRDVVFGESGTAEEALLQVKAQMWDLVVLAISLQDGFSVLRDVHARCPQTAVLVLSTYADSLHTARSLQLGASGYVSKSACRSDLLKAVRRVLAGHEHFAESGRQGVDIPRSAALHANLSAQEYTVLMALAAGSCTGKLAAELNLSGKTVSTYKRRVLNKLGLESTADLVRYVIDHKLSGTSFQPKARLTVQIVDPRLGPEPVVELPPMRAT